MTALSTEWHIANETEEYLDLEKELISFADEGNTSVDLRLTFDKGAHSAYLVLMRRNDDGNTRDLLPKEISMPWDEAIAYLGGAASLLPSDVSESVPKQDDAVHQALKEFARGVVAGIASITTSAAAFYERVHGKWAEVDRDTHMELLVGDAGVGKLLVNVYSVFDGPITMQVNKQITSFDLDIPLALCMPKVDGNVLAKCFSDDRVFEREFNAAAWFAQASVEDLRALMNCGLGGDYPADDVARHCRNIDIGVDGLLEYVESTEGAGFECYVDEDSAFQWLLVHRPDVLESLNPVDNPAP